ncbi:MAG: hypothetical protein ACLUW6_03520 [Coriobacteriaceae bacterium]
MAKSAVVFVANGCEPVEVVAPGGRASARRGGRCSLPCPTI